MLTPDERKLAAQACRSLEYITRQDADKAENPVIKERFIEQADALKALAEKLDQ